jgi:hypothetical protein
MAQLSRGLGSDPLHSLIVDAESLLKDLVVDRGRGREQGCRNRLPASVLAVESGEAKRRAPPHVELEVHQAAREHEQLAGLQGSGPKDVVGVHEPHVQLPLRQEQKLRGSRVGVGRVDASLGEVHPHRRDAQSVEAWELDHGGRGHHRLVLVVGVAGRLQTTEDEVLRCHLRSRLARKAIDGQASGVVRHAEVLEGVFVRRHGHHGHHPHSRQHSHHHPQTVHVGHPAPDGCGLDHGYMRSLDRVVQKVDGMGQRARVVLPGW